jgi:hypothetical protein
LELAVDIGRAVRNAGEAITDALKNVKEVALDPRIVTALLPIIIEHMVDRAARKS